MERGETAEALRAFEAAHLLSPDDEEVVELLEVARPKASAPKTLIYSGDGRERDTGESAIVTYEQKPTTIDGVELTPLPSENVEDLYSFSEERQETEAEGQGPNPENDGSYGTREDPLEEFGPEAMAFIEEAEQIEDASFDELARKDREGFEEPFAMEELVENVTVVEDATDILSGSSITEPGSAGPPPGSTAPSGDFPPQVGNEPDAVDEPSEGPGEPSPLPESLQATRTPGEVVLNQESPVEAVPAKGTEQVFVQPDATPKNDAAPEGTEGTQALPESEQEWILTETTLESLSPEEPPLDPSASAGTISTETLADLYAKQGLVEKAAEIYREILRERPEDRILQNKLQVLERGAEDRPATDPPSGGEGPKPESVPTGGAVSILEGWLRNAERMKRQ